MLRLVLPLRCLNCDLHIDRIISTEPLSKYLCSNCLRVFHLLETPVQNELQEKERRFQSLKHQSYLFASYAFSAGGQLLQRLIHHSKYNSMTNLAELLGIEAAYRIPDSLQPVDHIIPIPLHRTRYAERGYNQSDCIAKGMAKIFGKTQVSPSVLKRIKPTPSQTGLNAEEREENVRNAFKLLPKAKILKGKRILLVDDVMTTGATLASAAAELDKASPFSIAIVAVSAVLSSEF